MLTKNSFPALQQLKSLPKKQESDIRFYTLVLVFVYSIKNGDMLVNSIAHFIWQTLLASLIFGASQLLCFCSLLLSWLLDLYEVIEQETILLTSYKLQLRALRVLLAVSTLSARTTVPELKVNSCLPYLWFVAKCIPSIVIVQNFMINKIL